MTEDRIDNNGANIPRAIVKNSLDIVIREAMDASTLNAGQ